MTQIIETNERQTTKFDYKVEQVRMHTPDGTESRFFGNLRTDTNEVLGVVTDRYAPVQNSELFGRTEEMFKQKQMGAFESKFVVTHGGARARAVYRFPALGIKVKGQDLTFALKVQNSFDGSLRASFVVGLFRLICSNGMTMPHKTINLSQKHTSSLNLDLMGNGLDNAISQFHSSTPLFEKMADTRIDQKFGDLILDTMVKRKVGGLSDRQVDGIKRIWANPTFREDGERNLFNLYNAVTQHLSHEVEVGEKPRFELSERINAGVMAEFTRAVRSNAIESLVQSLN